MIEEINNLNGRIGGTGPLDFIRNFSEEELSSTLILFKSLVEVPKTDRRNIRIPEISSIEYFIEKGGINRYEEAYNGFFSSDGVYNLESLSFYNEKFVKEVDINEYCSTNVFNSLPSKYKTRLKKAGDPRNGFWGDKPNGSRGTILLQKYLEQQGKDPYDKKFVHFNDAELEHIIPETCCDFVADFPENWAWISAANNNWHSNKTPEEWRLDGIKRLSDRDEYSLNLEKAKKKSEDLIEKINSVDKVLEYALDLTVSLESRMEFIIGVSKSMGVKSKKLISGLGLKESFQETRIEPKVKGKNRTQSIDTRFTTMIPEWQDSYGANKPSLLIIQALVYTYGTSKYEEVRQRYSQIIKERTLNKWDTLEIFREKGKRGVRKELERKDKDFARKLKDLLDYADFV